MDPFAHLQEIKLIGMLVLGFFCYRRLKKVYDEPLQEEISEENEMIAENQTGEKSERNQIQQPEDPQEESKPTDLISEAQPSNEVVQVLNIKTQSEAGEIDQENVTGTHLETPVASKKKLIKKPKRSVKRPIRRIKNSKENLIV